MGDKLVGHIEKYFFIITILIVCLFHKGIIALFNMCNITIDWSGIYSPNFIITLIIIVVEFILVGFTLFGSTELRREYKYIRVMCSFFLILTALISVFGIVSEVNPIVFT